jgi:hypothetical protein
VTKKIVVQYYYNILTPTRFLFLIFEGPTAEAAMAAFQKLTAKTGTICSMPPRYVLAISVIGFVMRANRAIESRVLIVLLCFSPLQLFA